MNAPRVIPTIAELRRETDAARVAGRTVGFVPTMGFLHEGHRALMAAARRDCDVVVVSIFVNPLQFGANEDLAGYPRDLDRDLAACAAEGVDLVLHPTVEEMYPRPMVTTVTVGGLTERLCGASRPTHFAGVATVVAKLFNIVGPCRAYFGKKDYQQVAVVRAMVEDLDLPVEVLPLPTVREDDGLARSSRNTYLDADARRDALALSRALVSTLDAVRAGGRDRAALQRDLEAALDRAPGVARDYGEVLRGRDLEPTEVIEVGEEYVVAVAARVGAARLIDNATFVVGADGVLLVDAGVLGDGRPFVGA
jgi:pantoate--beta-alanine ligase